MLNKVPNSTDAMGVANNVRLTTMGAKQFSMVAVYLVIMQKSCLTRDERYNTKRKVHADEYKHCPGKE